MNKKDVYAEVQLSNGKTAVIINGIGTNYFKALSESKGDVGVMIKSLVCQLVFIDDKKITPSQANLLPIDDVVKITEAVSNILSSIYSKGV